MWQNTIEQMVYKQKILISCSFGGWEVQDQSAVLWGPVLLCTYMRLSKLCPHVVKGANSSLRCLTGIPQRCYGWFVFSKVICYSYIAIHTINFCFIVHIKLMFALYCCLLNMPVALKCFFLMNILEFKNNLLLKSVYSHLSLQWVTVLLWGHLAHMLIVYAARVVATAGEWLG